MTPFTPIDRRPSGIVGLILGLIVAFTAIVAGCGGQESYPPLQLPEGTRNVLVVDFRNMAENQSDQGTVRCPLSGQMFEAGPVAEEAEAILSGELRRLVKDRQYIKFISAQKLWEIQAQMLGEEGQPVSELLLLRETGRKLGADVVMAGHIYRFKERVGKKYAAESPASVAFDLHLVRVADGRVLWSKDFDETQKPLTENLFQLPTFLKRDGQWITARQMAAAAMERMIEGGTPKAVPPGESE